MVKTTSKPEVSDAVKNELPPDYLKTDLDNGAININPTPPTPTPTPSVKTCCNRSTHTFTYWAATA